MGIDRIGKGGIPPTPTPSAGGDARPAERARPGEARPAERTFDVHAPLPTPHADATSATSATGAASASPLEQLRAGRIDVERYVDLKVEEATAHLHGLGKKELGAITSMLREQVASDPALADLVTQAAGQAPKPTEE